MVPASVVAQDSSLVGRFGLGLNLLVGQPSNAEESLGKGYHAQLKYFPNPKLAFVLSTGQIFSALARNNETHPGNSFSISMGGELHKPMGSFSPYVGVELGVSFIHSSSSLVTATHNKYFINNLAVYLLKPKAGCMYAINDNLRANADLSYYWGYHPESRLLNPLFDNNGQPMFYSRKFALFSLGISYLFNE